MTQITQVETRAQADVLNRLHRASERLLGLCQYLSRKLGQVESHVLEGEHVNSLGELQGGGPELDRYCALREELASLAVGLGCSEESINEASKGGDFWATDHSF